MVKRLDPDLVILLSRIGFGSVFFKVGSGSASLPANELDVNICIKDKSRLRPALSETPYTSVLVQPFINQ